MNKLLQLKCCINVQQDNTYGILLISYVKVNDGNMMLLLVASQTLSVCFFAIWWQWATWCEPIMVSFLSHGLQQLNILKRSELNKVNIGFNREKVLYNLYLFGKLMNCRIQ